MRRVLTTLAENTSASSASSCRSTTAPPNGPPDIDAGRPSLTGGQGGDGEHGRDSPLIATIIHQTIKDAVVPHRDTLQRPVVEARATAQPHGQLKPGAHARRARRGPRRRGGRRRLRAVPGGTRTAHNRSHGHHDHDPTRDGPAAPQRDRVPHASSLAPITIPGTTAQDASSAADPPTSGATFAFWWLTALRGLRRGEVCGLRWTEIDLHRGVLDVARNRTTAGYHLIEGDPKTAARRRPVALDKRTIQVLRDHRQRQRDQQARRQAAGKTWIDSGYVFVDKDGSPIHPGYASGRFRLLVKRAGVPPVRLRDLRHGAVAQEDRIRRIARETRAPCRSTLPDRTRRRPVPPPGDI
ncbi:tyrosine-type recombinase/integrase [Micromonospora sp. KC606]|uniref:tyrosine-type recombinase/integrase n=1 Tax=Micromonospora sp. KC606 TaxID=2530379 RepID=UPI003264353F